MAGFTRNSTTYGMKRLCSKCRTPMEYMAMGEYKCPNCRNIEYDDYGLIRNYLDEHGPTPAAIIEKDTGVRRAVINDYLRRGRLEINDGSPVFIKCEICGKDIKFGRICAACAKNVVTRNEDSRFKAEEIGEEPTPLSAKTGRRGEMFTHRGDNPRRGF